MNNQDPAIVRKVEKAAQRAASEHTFEAVARAWHEAQGEKWTPTYAKVVMGRIERDIFPYLGRRPVSEIDTPELLEVLLRVERRGALGLTKRLREHCSHIFRFAVAHSHASDNPSANLKGAFEIAAAETAPGNPAD